MSAAVVSGMPVLIATSDADELATLRQILEPGAEVFCARTCVEALRWLRTGRISLVLCAAELADGNWRFVLRNAQDRPVVVFSRFGDEGLWAEVLNFGAYDLLLMPFNAEEVRRVTAAALRFGEYSQAPQFPAVL